ncbi:glycosyltransferase family 2 protein [Empedobacter falsenii]|uniref:glycosyltransferase family 2 protein n=1 Tax=Empedobacter TaxID=59734 RepID=UPI0006913EEB|nr:MULTISPECIES: glycosyltransferase family 2 protein [Empedobacter]MDH2206337.1 glycosyltransferase [Empedobacter sp. GD03644]
MKNLVSIIIPNYNRANLIGETLDSIVGQTYENWECIIVDDGSTDNSIEVIKTFEEKDPRFKLYLRPKDYPKGANACRNIGMEKSVGDYVIFFDSDDLMMENHISSKIEFMLINNLDYAVFKSKNFGQPEDIEEEIDYSYYKKYPFTADNYLLNKLRFFTNDLIVKSEILKKCEFFYKYNADIENVLMTQLVLISDRNGFKDETITLKRFHNDNLTQQIEINTDKGLLHIFYYYYNILNYIYNLNASPLATKFILSQLLYYYREINFKIDVNFFVLLYTILKFKNKSILIGVIVKKIKKK